METAQKYLNSHSKNRELLQRTIEEFELLISKARERFGLYKEYEKVLIYTALRFCRVRDPKLESEVKSLFESIYGDVFTNLHFTNLHAVYVTPNYLAFVFTFERKLRGTYNEDRVYGYNYHNYVIGKNLTTGKLFLHKVSYLGHILDYEREVISEYPVIAYIVKSDKPIFTALGYSYDIELQGETALKEAIGNTAIGNTPLNRVRVQGDLVLEINPIEQYFIDIREQIRHQYANLFVSEVLDRLANLLSDYGLHVITHNNDVIIRGIYRYAREKRLEIFRVLHNIILKELDLTDIDKDLVVDSNYCGEWTCTLLIVDKEIKFAIAEIESFFGSGIFGDPFIPIVVRVYIRHIPDKYIESIYQYAIKHISEVENVVRHGRHVIQYFGYPRTMFFTYRVLNRDVVFSVNPLHLACTKWIQITHPEHTPFYYQTPRPFAFRIHNVENLLINRENHYRIVKLIKQLGNSR